jgi:type I restriction enzyme S subunit
VSKWEMVKLSEAFDLQMGKTPSRSNLVYWINGANKWVSIADIGLADKYIHKTKETISDLAVAESGIKKVPMNTVIMSFKLSLGKTCIVQEDMYTNEAIMAFVDKGKYGIDKNYLYHLFRGKDWSVGTNKAVMGATLNKATLSNIEIPLPPLETQKQIAQTLDIAAELLSMRKQQLVEMDNLIKSTFYDMFGDPVTNEKGWEVEKLNDITTKIGSGATPRGGKESYQDEGISLIRSMNVHNGVFKYAQLAYLDEGQAKQLDNVTVKEKDVLINITGASVARSCIVPSDVLPARVNQHVSIVRMKEEKAGSEYINNLFTSSSFQTQLLSIGGAGGATREAITKQQLQELVIPLPPLELQTRFASIVTKIDEQKALVKKAIDETQYLFDSLMCEYFE